MWNYGSLLEKMIIAAVFGIIALIVFLFDKGKPDKDKNDLDPFR